MDLWERGLHAGLVGDAEAEVAAQEGRAASGGKEEDKSLAQSYHNNMLSRNLRKAVHQVTDREGGGGRVSPPGRPMDQNGVTSCRGPPGEAPGHACPFRRNPHMRSL